MILVLYTSSFCKIIVEWLHYHFKRRTKKPQLNEYWGFITFLLKLNPTLCRTCARKSCLYWKKIKSRKYEGNLACYVSLISYEKILKHIMSDIAKECSMAQSFFSVIAKGVTSNQSPHVCRVEWGIRGAREAAEPGDIIIY